MSTADPEQTIDAVERRDQPVPRAVDDAGARDYPDLAAVERQYAITNEIAKGGMGRIVEARDLRLVVDGHFTLQHVPAGTYPRRINTSSRRRTTARTVRATRRPNTPAASDRAKPCASWGAGVRRGRQVHLDVLPMRYVSKRSAPAVQRGRGIMKIKQVDLAQVRGGVRGPVTPMDYWASYWTNIMTAPMTFAPPFGQPFFRPPFG